ncbi:hypothetical protein ACE1CI_21350 [Aerosakkonemataceae cyanobacterium BLCC-F50]|uniref:LAGLIDADG homing endonuclease n=1 Tax=Floridaenema flaviceps BLCC-F50 TaxID=3153642 RepID=A0ABV4XX52_9CYAN
MNYDKTVFRTTGYQLTGTNMFPVQEFPSLTKMFGLITDSRTTINRQQAGIILNLPCERQLLLFGASYKISYPCKDFHLLKFALQQISNLLGNQASEYEDDNLTEGICRVLEESKTQNFSLS